MTCHVCRGSDVALFCTKNGHDVFRCQVCGLLFVHPLPNSTADIYTGDYFEGATKGFGYVHYDEDKEPMIPAFRLYLQRIRKVLGGEGALLDVGAATGFFVRLANNEGFSARGIEISDHAASVARAKGLDVRTGTLADIEGTFDCITMLDVIEHVPDPRKEFEKAAALLTSGGVLVINTPDAGSLFARMMGRYWHLIVPPEHLYYFNRSNMRRLLEETGFGVVEVSTIGKSFTLSYILKTLYRWTHVRLFDRLALLFSHRAARFAIPINLHDNMFILARKI